MKTLGKFLFLFILAASVTFCSGEQKIQDLIQPISVYSGQAKTVLMDDVFYSESYNLKFSPNENLKIDFSYDKNELTITPSKKFSGMTAIDFNLGGINYSIPVIVRHQTVHTFTYKPSKKYETLSVFGEFNDWNRHQFFMKDENGDGIFEVTIPIEPGTYQYKIFADGKEFLDPTNPDKIENGTNNFNNVITIPATEESKIFLHVLGDEMQNGNMVYKFSFEGVHKPTHLTPANVTAFLDNDLLGKNYFDAENEIVKIVIPANELKGQQMLRAAVTENGFVSNIQMVMLNDGKPFTNEDKFTWYDGIIYSLLIDRFDDGNKKNDNPMKFDSLYAKANYMGGDLQGIIDKLNNGYFSDLGINILWISPVYKAPSKPYREYPAPHRFYTGYHGYWPVSHTEVEPRFGDMAKLKELVKTAHSKNIKVLLDFVSNHVHIEDPLYKEHPDWFGKLELPDGRLNLRFWDEYRLTTWFEPYMPSFDYQNSKEAIDFMTDNAVWWLEQTGADGYRHDAVKHVPNIFWRSLTKKIDKEVTAKRKIPTYQIGETFGSYDLVSSYVNNGQLSAQFNFNLYNVAQTVFIKPDASFKALDADLKKTRNIYGALHYMGNIMDSHDKNRYMAYTDGDLDLSQWSASEIGWNNPPKVDDPKSYDKAVIYYSYMMAIPGLPVIYYGSEFGMTGASDPDNRRMMRFGDQLDTNEKKMLSEIETIVKLRNEHTALRYGDYYCVLANENLFGFIRSDMNERILVVINKSDKIQRAEIKFPADYEITELTDLVTAQRIACERDAAVIMMNGISWRYFILK